MARRPRPNPVVWWVWVPLGGAPTTWSMASQTQVGLHGPAGVPVRGLTVIFSTSRLAVSRSVVACDGVRFVPRLQPAAMKRACCELHLGRSQKEQDNGR